MGTPVKPNDHEFVAFKAELNKGKQKIFLENADI
jgi:hypothetical protein